jgi:hypothetical protein
MGEGTRHKLLYIYEKGRASSNITTTTVLKNILLKGWSFNTQPCEKWVRKNHIAVQNVGIKHQKANSSV